MNSSIIKVSDILNNAQNIKSVGFSAGYSLDKQKASEYFDNLIANSKYPTPIFSGILILEKQNDDLIVIDGIQRLTTINLLLCALCESYKDTTKQNEDARTKIFERFLLSEGKPKLKLNKINNEIYERILLSQELSDEDLNSNLYVTYDCFIKKMQEHKISGTELFNVISKIQFMMIFTDKSEVSARELYQALNNNKGESQINLIQDFVAQKDKTAGNLLNEVYEVFNGTQHLLEAFLRDFLLTRMESKTGNNDTLYNNFRNYFYNISKYKDSHSIMHEIIKYSKYYIKIVKAEFDQPEIKEQITILNENGGNDTYPYLMEVLDDLENSHLDEDAFLNILMMINLFIKSREDISISNVSIDFSSLSKELNKMLVLKDYVPEILCDNKLTINEINNLANFEV